MQMVYSEFWLLRQQWPRPRIWILYRYACTSLPMSSRSLPKECMPCCLPKSRSALLEDIQAHTIAIRKYFTSHTSIDSATYSDSQLLSVTIGCRPLFQDTGPRLRKFIQPPWLRLVIWQFAKLASTLPVSFQFAVPSDCVDQVMTRSRVQRKYFITSLHQVPPFYKA